MQNHFISVNSKRAGGRGGGGGGKAGQFDLPVGSRNVSSKEKVVPCFFVNPAFSLKFFKLFRRNEDFLCQY